MRVIFGFAAAAFLLMVACGEPLDIEPLLWRCAAEIPTQYGPGLKLHGIGPKGLYASAYIGERMGRLLVYDSGEFHQDYELTGKDEDIDSVAFYGNRGWLAGSKNHHAFLVSYKNGAWSEYREYLPGISHIDDLTPAGPGRFFCLATLPGYPQKRYLSEYANGSVRVFYAPGIQQHFAYARDARMIFALTYGKESPQVVVSGDEGTSWEWEDVTVPAGYEIENISDFTASPDALYITARLEASGKKWYAIIKRTGPPGEGSYEFSYLGYTGPGRGVIDKCVFRNNRDGVATGLGGTLHLDYSGWTAELCDPSDDFQELIPDFRGGFWALDAGGDLLYWHP